jgi:hypothetical protein
MTKNYEPEQVPTLLTVFNRPDLTRNLLNRLRDIGVAKLFISSDAPRNPADEDLVAEVRGIITTEIDWDCNVQTNLRETNLGLKDAMVSALDWFFHHVDEGIVLEDDCLPSHDFFRLCAELLPRFRDEPRVFQIAGDNTSDISIDQDWSYCFIRYPHIWGWATWKSSWALYDRDLNLWASIAAEDMTGSVFPVAAERRVWEPTYDRLRQHGIPDTWDFQWAATIAMYDGLSAQATVNLISNQGFRSDATHTTGPSHRSKRPQEPLGEIRHPPFVLRHREAEKQVFSNTQRKMGPPNWQRRLGKRVRGAQKWFFRVVLHRLGLIRATISRF